MFNNTVLLDYRIFVNNNIDFKQHTMGIISFSLLTGRVEQKRKESENQYKSNLREE